MKTFLTLLVILLAGCATPQTPPTPKPTLPPDLRLVCHNGEWAVVSELAEMGALFAAPCGEKMI